MSQFLSVIFRVKNTDFFLIFFTLDQSTSQHIAEMDIFVEGIQTPGAVQLDLEVSFVGHSLA